MLLSGIIWASQSIWADSNASEYQFARVVPARFRAVWCYGTVFRLKSSGRSTLADNRPASRKR